MSIFIFAKKFLYFLPILFIVILINYFVDPANLFRNLRYYEDIVEILKTGRNVALTGEFDYRIFQRAFINNQTNRNDILIIGSSQEMQLNSDFFQGSSFSNSWLSRPTLGELMSIYWMYRERRLLPLKVILGVNPWLFNKNAYDNHVFKTYANELTEINRYLEVNSADTGNHTVNTQLMDLVSVGYFQYSINSLIKKVFSQQYISNRTYYITDRNCENLEMVLHHDGSSCYSSQWQNMPSSQVKFDSGSFLLGGFSRLDPDLIDTFDRFITLMKRDDVQVEFILMPYHPNAYSLLIEKNEFRIIADVELWLINYAISHNIKLIGSYNPISHSYTADDFVDTHHLRLNSLKKIDIIN